MSAKHLKYYLVLSLGVAGSVGSIFSIQSLVVFSFVTALSPMPLVFSSFRGLDNWALQGAMALTFSDGERVEIPIDHRVMESIEGPHIRKIAYLAMPTLAPVVSKHRAFFAVKIGLCNFGPLSKNIPRLKPIKKIEFFIYDSRGEFLWYDQDLCD